MSITRYFWLPRRMSEFEQRHTRRMNRLGVLFLWCNVPVFVIVAGFNGTGPWLAVALSALVLAGPTAALPLFPNPRITSMILGFAAMCMGGLLVHFGQGPLQIEMHFYFFSLLAALAIYANPAVIWIAAVTVALHHSVIYLLLPSSVFNYDASMWVVAVHALFVVVESVAAAFLSRSFFDNVIELDQIVCKRTAQLDERNRELRLVLDHVNDGLVTIDQAGRMAPERSARLDEWLGVPEPGTTFDKALSALDPAAGAWFEVAWEAVQDGILPLEVTLAQLPQRVQRDGQHFRLSYLPVNVVGRRPDRVLIVLQDVSAEVARSTADAEQHELLRSLQAYRADRPGFTEFLDEAGRLVRDLVEGSVDAGDQLRFLHTLKGNALSFSLDVFAERLHALESTLTEQERGLNDAERDRLGATWKRVAGNLGSIIDNAQPGVRLGEAEYRAFCDALHRRTPHSELLHEARRWFFEPAQARLERLARHARAVATRLGKDNVDIRVTADHTHLHPDQFRAFWAALVHVVRNAVDHGIESRHAREALGKPPCGTLTLAVRSEGDRVFVEVHDDGRGIDWGKLRALATSRGLPASTKSDLHDALFADGVSTTQVVTEVSGRGVGMSAARAASDELHGSIELESAPGQGTRVRFILPINDVTAWLPQRAVAA